MQENYSTDIEKIKREVIDRETRRSSKLRIMKITALAIAAIIGLLSLFFSYYMFFGYMDSFPTFAKPEHEYYGGDAYTGIQNAASDTAINVAQMGDILKNYIYDFAFGMGALFLIIGLLILLGTAYAMFKVVITPSVPDKLRIKELVDAEVYLRNANG